jgi:hypothetical protein
MRIGITGHQRLSSPADWDWVEQQLDELLSVLSELAGFTSLALGADQLFVELILKRGGSFVAVVPFVDYELKFEEGASRDAYKRLLAQASTVEVLKGSGSNREAYFKAGKQVVNRSEMLLAVWDGKPAAGLGGTADAVSYARHCGKLIVHLNPINQTVNKINYE